jgi:hypothetical protein
MAFKSSDLVPDGVAGFVKAISAAITAAVALFIDAIADGSVTQAEWKSIGVVAVTAGFGAWFFPNSFKGFKNPEKARQVANDPLPPVV